MRIQRLVFTLAVTCISRATLVRDTLLGHLDEMRQRARSSRQPVSRRAIRSGSKLLDAAFVKPADGAAKAVLLICHGIGETIDYWIPVQQLLAAHGIASLVFDYAGYGKSQGPADWRQCEQDAVAAYESLKAIYPGRPISLLGFSMGSGVATAILERTQPEHLVLCAAFTSFRDAAYSMGVPRRCTVALPAIWHGETPLRRWSGPVLIVHGERDEHFPVQMAKRLADWCGENAEIVVVPNHSHCEPFYRPHLAFWGNVVARLVRE